MAESVESVVAKLTSMRNVTIEIKNLTENISLENPRVYLERGLTQNPPQPTVGPLKTEICTFCKTQATATGSVGVLTYDIFKRSEEDAIDKLALMFSVPFDYTYYMNWFAVGIYKTYTACDRDLYLKMYYDEDQRGFIRQDANGSGITYLTNYLKIKANMSPMAKSIMKVEIWPKTK